MINEEFLRTDLSSAKDKIQYDIKAIKDGKWLNMSDVQTGWMTAIEQCSQALQRGRNFQKRNIFPKDRLQDFWKLEKEWKTIYPLAREYERLLPRYNVNHPDHKLLTFKERTGYDLVEEIINYFPY